MATWTGYALFPNGTHFALSGIGRGVESFVCGERSWHGRKNRPAGPAFSLQRTLRLGHAERLLDLLTHVYEAADAPQNFLGYPRLGG